MRTLSRLSLLTLLLVLLSTAANAQTKPPRPPEKGGEDHLFIGATGGLGLGSYGLALYADVFVRYDQHIIDVRVAGTTAIFASDGMGDVGLLYGQRFMVTDDNLVGFSVMGGLALANGHANGESASNRLSVPLGVQLLWTPFRFVGLGLTGFYNINDVASFGGMTLSMQLGKLR